MSENILISTRIKKNHTSDSMNRKSLTLIEIICVDERDFIFFKIISLERVFMKN